MIVVMGKVRLPPENLPAAKPHMRAMVDASRAEAGCMHYAYSQDLFDPALFHVIERWRDREALKTHFQTPHMTAWRAEWPSLGIRDRDLMLVEAGAPEPI
jgi:quinol monooxygenase YgiN